MKKPQYTKYSAFFITFFWAKIFCPNPQKGVFRGCQQFETQYWSSEPKGCGLIAGVCNELSAGTARQIPIFRAAIVIAAQVCYNMT